GGRRDQQAQHRGQRQSAGRHFKPSLPGYGTPVRVLLLALIVAPASLVKRRTIMRTWLIAAAVCAPLGLAAFETQTPPPSSADPYANNAAAGTTQFPLAARAGEDSKALLVAPPGAVNQGPFDPATWKYGDAFAAPAGSKIWNPVKLKMLQGGKVTGGTFFSSTDPATYCAFANAGYDFVWTEMQQD